MPTFLCEIPGLGNDVVGAFAGQQRARPAIAAGRSRSQIAIGRNTAFTSLERIKGRFERADKS